MLVVSNLALRFAGADDFLFKGVTFTVNAGERVGLIGPNGSGKSILLKVIAGELEPTKGTVQRTQPNVRIGYLAQGLTPEAGCLQDVLFPKLVTLRILEAEVERLARSLTGDDDSVSQAYDAALEKLINLSEQIDEGYGQRILAQLDLGNIPLDTPVTTLSGGQKTRMVLASMLVNKPQLLILDEPTNHLDIDALEWLENWLNGFDGGVLVVSHDRAFLDRMANRIVAIDPKTGTARVHVGGYSDYLHTLQRERNQQHMAWKDQVDEIARMQADVNRTMARAIRKENATVNDKQRGYAKKVAKRAKAKETRLQRYLESDERVEKPELTWNVKMEFEHISQIRDDAVRLENLTVGYSAAKPLLTNLNAAIRGGERIAVMGPNGHGKSTLLKTIIGQLEPLAGRVYIGESVQVGYLAQEQDVLNPNSTALATIQSETNYTETEARSFLHFFLFADDDPLRPVSQLSYGERARLMLAVLVAQGANLLVMDEPLNHLDLSSREQFEQALANYPGSVLTVAHDRYFIDQFATIIWHIEAGQLDVEILVAEGV